MCAAQQVPVVIAGTACLIALSTAPALAADAEAAPRLVLPGGDLSVEVSCDPVNGDIPGTIMGSSHALAAKTMKLARVTGQGRGDLDRGPTFRGRATIAPAAEFAPEGANSTAAERTSEWDVGGVCPGGERWIAGFRVDQETTPSDPPSPSAQAVSGAPVPREAAAEVPEPGESPPVAHPQAPAGPVRTEVGEAGHGESVKVTTWAGGSALLGGCVAAAIYWRWRGSRQGN